MRNFTDSWMLSYSLVNGGHDRWGVPKAWVQLSGWRSHVRDYSSPQDCSSKNQQPKTDDCQPLKSKHAPCLIFQKRENDNWYGEFVELSLPGPEGLVFNL